MPAFVHPAAEVSPHATIGEKTKVWSQAHIREQARIGASCVIGKGAYVDVGVQVGNNVKIENYASLFHGATVADGVFIGPYACVANDRHPRAVTSDGRLKTETDWSVSPVRIAEGASIGAGAIVLPGVTVGAWALVGAGAVVTKDVPDHGLVVGNPARLRGFVCRCGHPATKEKTDRSDAILRCATCGSEIRVPAALAR